MVFDGKIEEQPCRVLKDDGANTNIISKSFYEKHKEKFATSQTSVDVSHSTNGADEESCTIVENARLDIQGHQYESKFVVADTRYYTILGTPWHRDVQPETNYDEGTVRIGDVVIASSTTGKGCTLSMNTISLGEFRRSAKEKGTQVFAVVVNDIETNHENFGQATDDPELGKIIEQFSDVFQSQLPPGLPPIRTVDHAIETDPDAKIPYRRLFKLSPQELKATREYIADNLENGRIRLSKSPYGAPLFFAKHENRPLRAVVDYRMLNKITKKNNTPTPRSDAMFDILGESKWFSKIDLKTGFHQIRVKPEHVEKTAFQTKYGQYEFLVLPMGLCNAPATFTTMMNEVLDGLIDKFIWTIYSFSRRQSKNIENM